MRNNLLFLMTIVLNINVYSQLIDNDIAKFSGSKFFPEDIPFYLTITPEKLYYFETRLNDSLKLCKLFRPFSNTYISICTKDNFGDFHGYKIIVDSLKGKFEKDIYVHGRRIYKLRKSIFTGDTTELLEQFDKNAWLHIEVNDTNRVFTLEDSLGLHSGYKKFYDIKSGKLLKVENYHTIAIDSIPNLKAFYEEYPYFFLAHLKKFEIQNHVEKNVVFGTWRKSNIVTPQIKSGDFISIRFGDWIYYDEKGNEIKREHYSYKSIKIQ